MTKENMEVLVVPEKGDHESAVTRSRKDPAPSPVSWRELIAVAMCVVLCDVTIFRGQGFAGYAVLFAAFPLLLLFGYQRPRCGFGTWLVGLMLLCLAGKLLWSGSGLLMFVGFLCVFAFAFTLSGRQPYILEVIVSASLAIPAGFVGLESYRQSLRKLGPPLNRAAWWNIGLPAVAFLVFGWLFVLANPDLLSTFSERLYEFATEMLTFPRL